MTACRRRISASIALAQRARETLGRNPNQPVILQRVGRPCSRICFALSPLVGDEEGGIAFASRSRDGLRDVVLRDLWIDGARGCARGAGCIFNLAPERWMRSSAVTLQAKLVTHVAFHRYRIAPGISDAGDVLGPLQLDSRVPRNGCSANLRTQHRGRHDPRPHPSLPGDARTCLTAIQHRSDSTRAGARICLSDLRKWPRRCNMQSQASHKRIAPGWFAPMVTSRSTPRSSTGGMRPS